MALLFSLASLDHKEAGRSRREIATSEMGDCSFCGAAVQSRAVSFIEGKNVTIDRRFAEGRLDRYADLVADLAQLRPDVSRKLVQPVEVRPKYLARTIPRTGLMELGGDHS